MSSKQTIYGLLELPSYTTAGHMTLDATNTLVLLKDQETTTDPTVTDDSSQGYARGSLWLNTVNGILWVLTDSSIGAALWKHTTFPGGGGFGLEQLTAESLAESANDSTVYLRKARITTAALKAGTYRIGWTYSWHTSTPSTIMKARISRDDTGASVPNNDGTELWFQNHASQTAATTVGVAIPVAGSVTMALAAGVHVLDLDFARGTGVGTVSIAQARLEFGRIA